MHFVHDFKIIISVPNHKVYANSASLKSNSNDFERLSQYCILKGSNKMPRDLLKYTGCLQEIKLVLS